MKIISVSGRAPALLASLLAALAVAFSAPVLTDSIDLPAPAAMARQIRALPLVSHRHYQVNAAIRLLPLPFLWIGRDRVGAADLFERRGSDGARAYEFAAESDPERVPRGINRWGYLGEQVDAGVTRLVGVIKQSDEKTVAEVQRSLEREAASARYPFKVYAGAITALSAHAGDMIMVLDRDIPYRDFERVLQTLPTTLPTGLKNTDLRPGTGPGVMQAVTSIIHARVEAWRARPNAPIVRSTVRCFFNNQVYQIAERSVSFVPSIKIGGRTYTNVLRGDFEGTQPGTDKRIPFEIVYGTAGELAEAPLRILSQPRWWFQVELILDPATGVPPSS